MAEVQPQDANALVANSGRIATAILAAWVWIIKLSLSRHFSQLDKLRESVDSIDKRLARIEGRIEQQDHER